MCGKRGMYLGGNHSFKKFCKLNRFACVQLFILIYNIFGVIHLSKAQNTLSRQPNSSVDVKKGLKSVFDLGSVNNEFSS